MKICIVGTGYVGLVTGACLADFGMEVTCVDKIKKKIDLLCRGEIPIYEPGLEVLVSKNFKDGRLKFTTDLRSAIKENLVIFIAVGTPQGKDGSADLSSVWEVADTIAEVINGYKVIVNKSTVPIGTAKEMKKYIKKKNPKAQFSVVSNPEFLREGSAIGDFMEPDRIVIGVPDKRSEEIMKEVYKPLYHLEIPVLITNVESAELIKYASNAFLASKISFINEIAALCEKVGGDVIDVARGMGLDVRIGPKFLQPGPGYGGSCFPKDTLALLDISNKHKYDFKILKATIEVNEKIKERMVEKIKVALNNKIENKTLGVLGLSFKPETDDIRESISLKIIEYFIDKKINLKVYDPKAMENVKKIFPEIKYCKNPYEVAENSNCLVFVTEWNEFRYLDLKKIHSLMKEKIIVDLRNIYDVKKIKEIGFTYYPVGRIKEKW
jgi:UDPglucose 6-dehydrogenase